LQESTVQFRLCVALLVVSCTLYSSAAQWIPLYVFQRILSPTSYEDRLKCTLNLFVTCVTQSRNVIIQPEVAKSLAVLCEYIKPHFVCVCVCVMKSFVFCNLYQIKDDEIDMACIMHGKMRNSAF